VLFLPQAKPEPEESIYNAIDAVEFMRDLRKLQQRTKCGNNTCVGFIKLFEQHLGTKANSTLPKSFAACDKALKAEAGVKCLELHGCTNCQRHVFAPGDKTSARCPECGAGRYQADGKPNERVFFFPIKGRLQKLMSLPRYYNMCQHEFERPRNNNYVTDVYDTPAWRKFMGPVTFPIQRIGLQFCVDAIPAFAAGTLSLKPAEFINLSLPPSERAKSENILLSMLLPANLPKGQSQKKYFDFIADFELNEMATIGIMPDRIPVKVKIFSTSMDTKGREELTGNVFVGGAGA